MREAFEVWAEREGQIVRRREDKPEAYLVFGTQRQWQIWQAALANCAPEVTGSAVAKPELSTSTGLPVSEAEMRQRVLDEILGACKRLDPGVGADGVLKLIEGLKGK
jgi:hypothetical protein